MSEQVQKPELNLNELVEETKVKNWEKELIKKEDIIYEVQQFGRMVEWTKHLAKAEGVFSALRGQKELVKIENGFRQRIKYAYIN